MELTIFTIGHSNHSLDHFFSLLKRHNITALCDVRSKPYSRNNPQFNREDLKSALGEHYIAYVFLGKELGARTDDPSCYDGGKVQYDRLARSELFRSGLSRLEEGAKKYRVAIMCAEKEPLDCHRTILVARQLSKAGIGIQHILADGRLESQGEALSRLVHAFALPDQDMFRTHDDVLDDAYRLQGERIAYDRGEATGGDTQPMKRAAG